MNAGKMAMALALLASLATLSFAQNATPPYYNSSRYGNYTGGFHAAGAFGLLVPVLIGIIILLLVIAIALAYLLIKEKGKNKRRAK